MAFAETWHRQVYAFPSPLEALIRYYAAAINPCTSESIRGLSLTHQGLGYSETHNWAEM